MSFYTQTVIIARDYTQELIELEQEYELPNWFYTTSELSWYIVKKMKLLSKTGEEANGICRG